MKQRKKGAVLRWLAGFAAVLMGIGLCSALPVRAAYENSHANTGNPRTDLVEIAKTQIGYMEGSLEGTVRGSNNYTKYNVWNGRISGYDMDGYGYPWCHTFVSWCASQAGIGTDVIPRTAGTGTGRSFFVKQGTYQQSAANGGSYVPRAGDLIYYGSGAKPSHVGIVASCDGTSVYAIEGNCLDMVTTRTIGLSDAYIIGYGVPNYVNVHPAPSLGVTPGNSSTETVFSWNAVDGATRYDLKIWKNQIWEGDAYQVEWSASAPCSTVLPEGTYQAYVDACFGDEVQMSNVVTFSVGAAQAGDLNADGAVTAADAVLLQRYLLGEETLTKTQQRAADENGDGAVNGFDLALLRQTLTA